MGRCGGCLVCGGTLLGITRRAYDAKFGIKKAYNLAQCAQCSLVQLSAPPSLNKLETLYEKYYNFGGEKDTVYTLFREWFLSSTLYRFWISLDGDFSFHRCKGNGRLLDIGCNEGRGLSIFRKNGFDPEGLELNEVAAQRSRAKGLTVHTKLLETFKPENLYDVVVLSNVIEHLLDPKAMLNHVNRILKAGGEIWTSCPNVNSWQRKLFGRYWINWHVPFHIVHFSQKNLTNILKETGFEIQEIRQESPALWVAHSVIVRLFAKPGQPTKQLRNPFLIAFLLILIRTLFFPLLWIGNRLGRGDCLIAIARKQNK